MTSDDLRQRAQTHRTIHANRTFALYGTSEGVTKGWETRRGGNPAAVKDAKRVVKAVSGGKKLNIDSLQKLPVKDLEKLRDAYGDLAEHHDDQWERQSSKMAQDRVKEELAVRATPSPKGPTTKRAAPKVPKKVRVTARVARAMEESYESQRAAPLTWPGPIGGKKGEW